MGCSFFIFVSFGLSNQSFKIETILAAICGSQNEKLCNEYLTVGFSEKPTPKELLSLNHLSAECSFVFRSTCTCEEQLSVSVEVAHASSFVSEFTTTPAGSPLQPLQTGLWKVKVVAWIAALAASSSVCDSDLRGRLCVQLNCYQTYKLNLLQIMFICIFYFFYFA